MKSIVRPVGSIAPIAFIVIAGVIGGALGAISQPLADGFAHGVQVTLGAIPEGFYALGGTAYLGYAAARQFDKNKDKEVEARTAEAGAIAAYAGKDGE